MFAKKKKSYNGNQTEDLENTSESNVVNQNPARKLPTQEESGKLSYL